VIFAGWVSALSFLQCIDTDGSGTGKAASQQKRVPHIISGGLLPEEVEKENEWSRLHLKIGR